MANRDRTETSPTPIPLTDRFAALDLLPDRTPDLSNRAAASPRPQWVDVLSDYRDGRIFIAYYSGESAWERHPDDEIVLVIDGETVMTLAVDGAATEYTMTSMQLIVVPANTWHRFHTADRVQVMTVSPQPTEHRIEDPPGLH